MRLGPVIPLRETGAPIGDTQLDFQIDLESGRALAQEYGMVLPDVVDYPKEQLYNGGM